MTSAAGAPKATALLGAIIAALVLWRRASDRSVAIQEFVNAIHELVTDCYHDLRELRVNHDGVRALGVRNAPQ